MKNRFYVIVIVIFMLQLSACAKKTSVVIAPKPVPQGQAKKQQIPPGQAKKMTGDKSAKAHAPGQQKK